MPDERDALRDILKRSSFSGRERSTCPVAINECSGYQGSGKAMREEGVLNHHCEMGLGMPI